MATWKKIIVSGSSAHLLDVTASNLIEDRIVIAGPEGALESTDLKYSASLFEFGNATVSGSIFSGSQFSGSFFGDGSGLTGVTAEWDGSHVGNASITGSFTVSGSTGTVVDFTGVDAISGSMFSGSFEGDGSRLTGIATVLELSGSNATGSVDLKTEPLVVLGTDKEVEVIISGSSITIGLPDDVEISGSLIVSGSLTGSTALFDYIQVTGSQVINDLTASYAMYAETLAINSGGVFEVAVPSTTWIVKHNLFTKYPIVTVWDGTTNKIVEPSEVTSIDYHTTQIDFTVPVSGWVNISRAGHVVSGSLLWENLVEGPSGSQVIVSDTLGVTGSFSVTGSVVDFTGVTAISGSMFSGSFEGDGSRLTGIATSLAVSASDGNSDLLDLKTEGLTISGSANEIEVFLYTGSNTIQIGLPDNVTITKNLTVGGDLIVNGDTTIVNTTELVVEDKFILLASGSTSATDGGIVVQSSGSSVGYAFGMDASAERWALQTDFASTSTSLVSDSYINTVQFGLEVAQPAQPMYGNTGSAYGNMWVSTDTGDIFIWA